MEIDSARGGKVVGIDRFGGDFRKVQEGNAIAICSRRRE